MIPPDRVVTPTRHDPVARSASQLLGGPLGKYADPLARGWRRLAAVLAGLVALPMAASVWLRGYCLETGWPAPGQFFHMCFSDLPATYSAQGLHQGLGGLLAGLPESPAPAHPPLTSLLLAWTGGLVPHGTAAEQLRFFFGVWAVLATALAALLVWWTAGSTPRTPMRAAHLAFSPVLALTALISPDIAGVALTGAGLYAWSRTRPLTAGVLLGLAIAARTYPLLVLLAILFVALRAGRWRAALPTISVALSTAAAVFVLLSSRNGPAASAAYLSWLDSGAGFGSPWVLPQLAGSEIPAPILSVLAIGGWLAAVLVGGYVALSGTRRPGVAEISLIMVAIVLVTGKSFPVQSSLWLVPLVALVGLRWRDHLIWAACEALHFGGVWLHIAGQSVPERGLPVGWYAVSLAARVCGVLWLAWQTLVLLRERLPATIDGEESDPLAGPLAGAGDTLVVQLR